MAAANGANGAAPSNRSMTALDLLRQHTRIDCDTLDTSLAARYGPFVDCTSNQAIAHFQLLSEGDAQSTAREAAGLASQWKSNAAFEGVDAVLLAVEAAVGPALARWEGFWDFMLTLPIRWHCYR